MKRKSMLTLLVAIFAFVVFSGCAAAELAFSQTTPPAAVLVDTEIAATQISFTQPQVLDALEETLAAIYADVNPAVVSIKVVQTDILQGLPGFNIPESQVPEEQYQYSTGSGFVWDQSGHIVTNYHVVEDAEKITVQFYDGEAVSADLIAADPDSDLAVLLVDVPEQRLHPVRLADSTQVNVGQISVAIGNPFGLENTMTVGFVSALGRSLPVESADGGSRYSIPDVIQTDAPINPGNSGGVLVNDSGEVIGVTSAIISPVQASVGIGFAIPSAIVQQVVPALISDGDYVHAWIGVSGTSLAPDLAVAMGLDENQRGALIIEVLADGPAADAGLRGGDQQLAVDGLNYLVGGDVIVALADMPVDSFETLVANLARFRAGEQVQLSILRDGREQQIEMVLGARPGEEVVVEPATPLERDESAESASVWLGVTAMPMNAELAAAMALPPDQVGILLGEVVEGSPADKAALRGSDTPAVVRGSQTLVGGDILLTWNDQPLEDVEQMRGFLRASEPGDTVILGVLRAGRWMTVDVLLEAPVN